MRKDISAEKLEIQKLTQKIFIELSEIATTKSLKREYVGEKEAKEFNSSFKDGEIKLAIVDSISESGVGSKQKEYIETFSIATYPFDKSKTVHIFFTTDCSLCSCKIGGSPRFRIGDGGYKAISLDNARMLLELIAQAKSKMPEFSLPSKEELQNLAGAFIDLYKRGLIPEVPETPLDEKFNTRIVGIQDFRYEYDSTIDKESKIYIVSIATSSGKNEIMHFAIDPRPAISEVFAFKIDNSARIDSGKKSYEGVTRKVYNLAKQFLEEKFQYTLPSEVKNAEAGDVKEKSGQVTKSLNTPSPEVRDVQEKSSQVTKSSQEEKSGQVTTL